MVSFAAAVAQIKGNLDQILPDTVIDQVAQLLDYTCRDCTLTPDVTARLVVRRCLEGGTAVGHLRRLSGLAFHDSSYGRAVQRLPETFFTLLTSVVTAKLRRGWPSPLWHGHRVLIVDGTGVSMPDTPPLQRAFGQPGGQRLGCGFPVAHLLVLFDHTTGHLVETHLAQLRTHDLTHTPAMHAMMHSGDLLVGDRAFGSFAHLTLLRERGLHGLFRRHQRRPAGVASDRLLTYSKPKQHKSLWLSKDQYAALPETITVREVAVRVRQPGRRVRHLVLVTTLLDRRQYPARDLAKLYEQHWQVETFHKVMKSGCRAEDSRLRTAARLANLIAMMCIVAWRVLWLTMLNRTAPELPATLVFTEVEMMLLNQLVPAADTSRKGTLGDYLNRLARLGGYLNRRNDTPPGCVVLWRGMTRLMDIQLGNYLAQIVGN